jgi:hypothetical protein
MGTAYNPKLVTSGLVLCLDPGNKKNYELTSVQYLIVGGGGGGGGGVRFSGGGGGGGGGGVLAGTTTITAQSYTVTVGGGGTAAGNVNGTNGGNSSFNGITASGGGGGGKAGGTTQGLSGGSGGGSGGTTPGNTSTAGTGTVGQGNDGGAGSVAGTYNGGGGGGAGAVGNAGSVDSGGGNGTISSITGVPTYYGGGGAGGAYQTTGTRPGGLGGGGDSGRTDGSSGTANTGGGGGGSGIDSNSVTVFTPGSGGSGIVIIRYPGPQRAVGGTVTQVGTDIVHTFTNVGSATFIPNYSASLSGVVDLSGNNNFTSTVNGTSYSVDNGGILTFDGVNDYCIKNSFDSSYITGDFTFSVWVKFAVLPQINPRFIHFSTDTDNIWHLAAYGGNDPATNSFFWFERKKSGTFYGAYQSSVKYTTNTWYNVTGTFNNSTNSSKLYINGVLISSSNNVNGGGPSTNNDLYIGSSSMNGNLANINIYNRELLIAEIQQNFQATRGRYGI